MEDFRINVTINEEDRKSNNKAMRKAAIVTAGVTLIFWLISMTDWCSSNIRYLARTRQASAIGLGLCIMFVVLSFGSTKGKDKKIEYHFTDRSLIISERDRVRSFHRSALRCYNNTDCILISDSGNKESFSIPKRVLTVSEAERIFRYFKMEVSENLYSDAALGGERCEKIDFHDDSCILEKRFLPDKKYLKKASKSGMWKVVVASIYLVFGVVLAIIISSIEIIFSVILLIKVVFDFIAVLYLVGNNKGMRNVVFRDSCFELTYDGKTDRVFYNEIIGLKDYDGAIGVVSNKIEVFLPKDEEMLRILESKVYAKS